MNTEYLQDLIVQTLREFEGGLTVSELHNELLDTHDVEYSKRKVQQILSDLCDGGPLSRERRSDGSPGRPPYYYFYDAPLVDQDDDETTNEVPDDSVMSDSGDFETITLQGRGDIDLGEINREAGGKLPAGVYWDIVEDQLNAASDVTRVKQAAEEIAELDPLETLLDMIEWTVEQLNQKGEELWKLHQEGRTGDLRFHRDLYDDLAEWAEQYFQAFWQLTPFDRQGPDIIRIPDSRDFIRAGNESELLEIRAMFNREKGKDHLDNRVFGDAFVTRIDVSKEISDIVGTDSSVAQVRLPNNVRLTPETGFELFAGAAALDHNERQFTDFDFTPKDLKQYRQRRAFRKGLIISRAAARLSDGEVTKARFAALDLRQYREAIRVIEDDADWVPHGDVAGELSDYTGPDVMFLDGRLTPIVHQQSEFGKDSLYGELVRREIREFAKLTDYASEDAWETDTTFAGVVKQPGISWFSPIVFWYIETQYNGNSVEKGEKDMSGMLRNITQPPISDVILPHLLFTGLSESQGEPDADEAFITFRALRRFYDNSVRQSSLPALDPEDNLIDVNTVQGWMDHFERSQQRQEHYGSQTIDLDKYRRFGFANVCANAGALMCYAGPPNLYSSNQRQTKRLPRIEVLTNPAGDAPEKLKDAVSSYAQRNYPDEDHAIDGHSTLDDVPVIVPNVIVESDKIAKYARDRISDDITREIRDLVRDLGNND